MNSEYYTLLELNKSQNPSDTQIKKAYKKQALKWHPDRNKDSKVVAENKFKSISEAYQVLSDPEKKHAYDQYGKAGLKEGAFSMPRNMNFNNPNMGYNTDPGDIFRNVFGARGFNQFGNAKFSNTMSFSKGNDNINKTIKTFINCSLEELFTGTIKKLKITENNGEARILELIVKKGWKQGTKITYPGNGGRQLIFIIKEKPHKLFRRDGNDLIWDCKITNIQAQSGVRLTIPVLNGPSFTFRLATGEIPDGNSYSRILGKGMPIKNTSDNGDLLIKFIII